MRRREFIALVGGAAAVWSGSAVAQGQAAIPVIGYLSPGSPESFTHLVAAFRKGLSETGYVEGQNVSIEYRWAHGEYAMLPELAAHLVRRGVAVIATPHASSATLAAKAATTTIPIVFSTGSDPVQIGLVASLSRPGGNVTGITGMTAEVGTKRLGLLRELIPSAARFAMLVNPKNSQAAGAQVKDAQAAAATIDRQIEVFTARTSREIDIAFADLVQKRVDALLVTADSLFINRRVQLATLAARYALPTIFPFREDAEAGGLMSYGPNLTDNARLVGVYTGRILMGEKPADMPVLRATKFEFIINLQTAKTISIEIPPTLLARADEVIE